MRTKRETGKGSYTYVTAVCYTIFWNWKDTLTSDQPLIFSHFAWISGADEFHIEARKSHEKATQLGQVSWLHAGFGKDMSDDIGYPWLPYKEFQCRFRNDWHDDIKDIRPPRSAFLRRIKLINGWKFLWTNIFIMMQNKLYIIVKYCEVRGFGKSCCQSPERIRAVRAICQIHLL